MHFLKNTNIEFKYLEFIYVSRDLCHLQFMANKIKLPLHEYGMFGGFTSFDYKTAFVSVHKCFISGVHCVILIATVNRIMTALCVCNFTTLVYTTNELAQQLCV